MTITQTEIEAIEEVVPYDDTEDGNPHLTHIVNPPSNVHIWRPGMEASDIVNVARLTGNYVIALCGLKIWPKRNPDKYPACQACMDEAVRLMGAAGE